MATRSGRRPQNVAGDFFVDSTCIDCDTCRWMAPETFARTGEQSSVHHQPVGDAERMRALQALVSCPTNSIGTEEPHAMKSVLASLPDLIEAGVYHCGYHHEASFGAASYLVVRPGGNVLVDSPRFAGPLVKRIEQLGGVDTLFLTHKDDVADHRRFHEHFGCRRVIHADDAVGDLRGLESLFEGTDTVALDSDLTVIPVPGHTKGSACLLFGDRFLFTGDHLAWSEGLGQLYAFRSATWYDWEVQIESMRRLAGFDFEWVLPGHGRRKHMPSAQMRGQMQRAIDWMVGR